MAERTIEEVIKEIQAEDCPYDCARCPHGMTQKECVELWEGRDENET